MRIFNKYAYMGAIALVGAVGFTACSSDDDLAAPQNPTFDGESVKTQFAISIPGASKNGTRLSEYVTQGQGASSTFRGMTNIRLVPFKSTASFSSDTPLTDVEPIGLQNIAEQGLQTNGNYKVYNDVDIEVGVNRFLFYGEAIATAGGNKANGSIIPSYEVSGWPKTTLADVNFDLRSILDNRSVKSTQDSLKAMLVAIASVSTNEGANLWSAETGNDLANYYSRFISLKAGSSNSIKAALADLYSAMKSDKVADNNNLKAAICTAIEKYFTPGDASTEGLYPNFEYTEKNKNIAQFPGNVGLPDGSMQLVGDATFAYTTPSTVNTGGNVIEQTAYSNYAYPASLFYWDDTAIKCQNTTLTDGTVYTGVSNWSDVLNLYSDNKTSVDASTRSIALVTPINYAVANLNLYARFADQYIYDNGDNYTPTGASQPVGQIAVPVDANGFSLTGILIGDQKKVGYDFKPMTGSTAWTIYDSSTDGAKVKKSADYEATPTAYSLALETSGTDNAPYETVRFALELVNESGAAFTGKDGIVPAGGKFYLVGELDANNDHKKVFEQDHKTIARVTINSLKSAYNCIPDLRAPRLELGLSVDLKWEEGLTDEVVIE